MPACLVKRPGHKETVIRLNPPHIPVFRPEGPPPVPRTVSFEDLPGDVLGRIGSTLVREDPSSPAILQLNAVSATIAAHPEISAQASRVIERKMRASVPSRHQLAFHADLAEVRPPSALNRARYEAMRSRIAGLPEIGLRDASAPLLPLTLIRLRGEDHAAALDDMLDAGGEHALWTGLSNMGRGAFLASLARTLDVLTPQLQTGARARMHMLLQGIPLHAQAARVRRFDRCWSACIESSAMLFHARRFYATSRRAFLRQCNSCRICNLVSVRY